MPPFATPAPRAARRRLRRHRDARSALPSPSRARAGARRRSLCSLRPRGRRAAGDLDRRRPSPASRARRSRPDGSAPSRDPTLRTRAFPPPLARSAGAWVVYVSTPRVRDCGGERIARRFVRADDRPREAPLDAEPACCARPRSACRHGAAPPASTRRRAVLPRERSPAALVAGRADDATRPIHATTGALCIAALFRGRPRAIQSATTDIIVRLVEPRRRPRPAAASACQPRRGASQLTLIQPVPRALAARNRRLKQSSARPSPPDAAESGREVLSSPRRSVGAVHDAYRGSRRARAARRSPDLDPRARDVEVASAWRSPTGSRRAPSLRCCRPSPRRRQALVRLGVSRRGARSSIRTGRRIAQYVVAVALAMPATRALSGAAGARTGPASVPRRAIACRLGTGFHGVACRCSRGRFASWGHRRASTPARGFSPTPRRRCACRSPLKRNRSSTPASRRGRAAAIRQLRGGPSVEPALIDAVRRRLAGAALDVQRREPLPPTIALELPGHHDQPIRGAVVAR